MLGELTENPVALYQEIVGSWRPGRLLGADSEAWQELAGQNAIGPTGPTHGPILKTAGIGSWRPGRLLGADSEILAGAGWPECYRTY